MSQLVLAATLLPILLLQLQAAPPAQHTGMRLVKGGTYTVGSAEHDAHPSELPRHRVTLKAFWIDTTEVTNAQFKRFVDATHYVTVAERPVQWEQLQQQLPAGTPKPPDSLLQPGSLVFHRAAPGTPTTDASAWWSWVIGASWQHPDGPGSTIANRMDHPVVHVAYEDAVAYATWAGKRLPTEHEWEVAARGGQPSARYPWKTPNVTDADSIANIWQGTFPSSNTGRDGFEGTAPVASYEPNGGGLYDMGGNVWEWCSDLYRADAYEVLMKEVRGKVVRDPRGPATSWDPDDAVPTMTKHVIRGGSFLCHASYCESYRVAARRGESPDTGMSHIGFRCVADVAK